MKARIAVCAMVAMLTVGLLPDMTPAVAAPAQATPGIDSLVERLAARWSGPPTRDLHASASPKDLGTYAPGTIEYPDTEGDGRITQAGATFGAHVSSLTVVDLDGVENFVVANGSGFPESVIWAVDLGVDGTTDRLVFLVSPEPQLLLGVVTDRGGERIRCFGNVRSAQATNAAGQEVQGESVSVSFPTRCLGAFASVRIAVRHELPGVPSPRLDFVPDSGWTGPTSRGDQSVSSGALVVLDAANRTHWIGVGGRNPARPLDLPYPYRLGPMRGLGFGLDGANGYGVDDRGNASWAVVGNNYGPPDPPDGAPRFSWPIARGVAVGASGASALVLDGFGGLHGFTALEGGQPPPVIGGAYWPGWDIARGVALLPNGTGGFVVDGFGGLHFFSLGQRRGAPRVFGAAYWPGWDAARGVALLPDGTGGWVLDLFGGLHFFSLGAPRTAPHLYGAPYFPGTDSARSVTFVSAGHRLGPALSGAEPTIAVAGIRESTIDATGDFGYATSQSDPQGVEVLDLTTWKSVARISTSPEPNGLSLSRDGTELYVGVQGGIDVINVTSRQLVRTIPGPSVTFTAVASGPPGTLYALEAGEVVARWVRVDIASGAVTPIANAQSYGAGIRTSADGTKAVMAGVFGIPGQEVVVYDATTGTTVSKIFDFVIRDVGISPDGSRIVLGNGGRVYDDQLNVVGRFFGRTSSVAFHPTEPRVFTLENDTQVREYDLATMEQVGTFGLWAGAQTFPASSFSNLSISADGRSLLATVGYGVAVIRVD